MITLRESIENIFRDIGKEDIILKSKIRKILADILGESIASGIQIKSFKNGKLTLKSTNSLWAFEISINKNSIIDKLNEHLENKPIKDIVSR
jgi:hypothetical protein